MHNISCSLKTIGEEMLMKCRFLYRRGALKRYIMIVMPISGKPSSDRDLRC